MNEEERIREEFKQNFGYEIMHKFNIKSGSLSEEITYFAFTNLLSLKGLHIEADNQDLPEDDYSKFPTAQRGREVMLTPKDGDVWVKCKVKEEQ